MPATLYPTLLQYLEDLRTETDLIPAPRRATLSRLAGYIREQRAARGRVRLHFIGTHDSRRSHLAQIWLATLCAGYGYRNVETYSGGTAVTAVNPRTIAALERAGFRVADPGGDNPRYRIAYGPDEPPLIAWSKTFDDPANPATEFAAIMICSEADADCAFIPGAELRLSLTYEDPKIADGTPQETRRYDERTRQIGRELLWLVEELAISSPPIALR